MAQGKPSHKRTRAFYRLREEAYKKQKKRCFYCGIKMVPKGLRKDGLSGDLVIPASKGGLIEKSNIVAACRGCNASKENWPPGHSPSEPVVQKGSGMDWDELWKVVIVAEGCLSAPAEWKTIPITVHNIMQELRNDVQVYPKNGDLSGWNSQGVLLWGAGPSCSTLLPALSKKGIVFALLGRRAEDYRACIDEDESEVIVIAHPTPRGAYAGCGKRRSANSFSGSRLFSTINTKLVELGHSPVDWSL